MLPKHSDVSIVVFHTQISSAIKLNSHSLTTSPSEIRLENLEVIIG